MWDESTNPRARAATRSAPYGAPGTIWPPSTPTVSSEARTEILGSAANTATFPTVFGAGVTMTSVGDPLVGRLLDGRYQITQRLARGGMATVYQAVDTRLTRTVAVKVMHVGLGDDVEFARKFDREARAAARLSHPNVVSVFDQGQDTLDGGVSRPYIVMEYVDGQTLRDVIVREAPLPPLRALEMIEPVLAALASAHDAELVHRDVKPENVLISARGQIKVADFGLAKAISSQTQTATQGLLIGTVSYLPPELVVSGRSDARSDVYSAGVVLFELLTGKKPHTGETPIQVAYAHVHTDVPAPSSLPTAGYIPAYLDALVARATAREPDARPHDARVLLSHVRRVRAALRQGVRVDPELTQVLAPLLAPLPPAAPDRADFEPTQLVPPAGPGPTYSPPAQPTHYSGRSPYSPPTVVDAPPPAPRSAGAHADRVSSQRERQARKRRRGWLAFLLVLLLTTAAALTGWYLTEGRFTTAPALSRLSQAEAEQVATKSDLQIHFASDYSETVAKGLVISTDPSAGAKVLMGGRLDAVVSKGPERFAMPTVVGLSQAAATEALTKANLALGQLTTGFSNTVAKGLVLKASKAPGVSLKRNAAVDLTVSAGPKPIKVKNYTGKSADDAVAALRKVGFLVTETTAISEDVAKDLVVSQDPASGSRVRGETITVVRSLGPPLVTVPNVQSMGVRAAQQVMSDAGFKTRVKAVAVNYIGVGYVVYSRPGSRAEAPKGSTITLYVV